MLRYQIRDVAFGLSLIEAPTAAAAMRAFSRKLHAELQPGDYKIADYHDGTASVLFRGFEYLRGSARELDEIDTDMELLA